MIRRRGTVLVMGAFALMLVPFIALATLNSGGYRYGASDQAFYQPAVLKQLEELSRRTYVSPYHFAYVHAGLGERDRALDWLERAFEERAGAIYGIQHSFLFTTLRSEPRFPALLRRMNLA